MGNTVSNPLSVTQIWLDKNDRPRQKWLNEATKTSVLEALTSNLYEGSTGLGPIPAVFKDAGCKDYVKYVFDTHGVIDPSDKKKYWTEKEFLNFLRNRFHGLTALEGSIPILWRCFLFHGYFPFPQESQDRIDCDGFLRAVAFIAADGTARLGDDAIGATINLERDRSLNGLWRIYRSLAIPSKNSVMEQESEWSQTDDLLDCLALVQPSHGSIMTIPRDELKPHASRILDISEDFEYGSIPREDLLNLLKLLLSIGIDEPEWGAAFNTAHPGIGLDDKLLDRLASSIISQFVSDESREINWPCFKKALSIFLPNIPSQFTLLFTSFLVPGTSPDSKATEPSPKDSILSLTLAQYLSLLNPPYQPNIRMIRGNDDFEQSKTHFSLQSNPRMIYSSSSTSASTPLESAVASLKAQTLLLITGQQLISDGSANQVTIAVYMSSPWDTQGEHKIGTTHGIFQLEPRLEILRPANPQTRTRDLVMLDSRILRFGNEDASGLTINLEEKSAILRSASQDGNGYLDVKATDNEGKGQEKWETKMKIERLEVYALEGHVSDLVQEEQRERALQGRIQGWTPGSTEKGVSKDELSKRIQGFGSAG